MAGKKGGEFGQTGWNGIMIDRNINILSLFHPLIAKWFEEQVGPPTDVQEQGWPRIAAGEHVLITAPTGSGKTLTAFLWAINQLLTGAWPTGHTSVLYISPLKALNNDIHRNLLKPLDELKQVFERHGSFFPPIRVRTRSGDTPQSDRRRMLRNPPEILITTPESLNLLLSSVGGRSLLNGISTVILDEIHGVVGNKRGVHLITAVERLVPLSGEFQRIALSATIRPIETVSEFIAGFRMEGNGHNPRYIPRPVSKVVSAAPKQYDIRVRFPEEVRDQQIQGSIWKPLVKEFKEVIDQNRSTLLFANSRRLCEKLTLMVNQGEERPIAYAHHGSLSREIREEVEGKLKAGELQAIVATNSLEMGIDIGALDEVLLIQAPPSISSAIQRVGRAGHLVGQVSRGTLFPTHSYDLLESAVLAPGILSQDMESIEPIHCPLDVLAQVIISMVGVETWNIDDLYVQLKASYPYQHLSRKQFDLVLNMLGGRYSESRIRELKPRISIDRLDNTVVARRGALLDLYMSGGMIPDRGYFHLRHDDTDARIGELDEEFVWEAAVGQRFTLGTQNWRIKRITHNDVFVVPDHPKSMATPFWKGEENSRDFHFSTLIGHFLEDVNGQLTDPDLPLSLERDHCMDRTAAEQLISFLKRQKERTKCDLPHRHHLVIEFVNVGPGSVPGNQVILHTLWGGRVNRPFAMALDAAWEARFGQRLEVYAGNDCVVLLLPHHVGGDELLSLVTSNTVEALLRKRLEGSGFFGARFRECAGRALLLPRYKINERVPLWMSRLRSQKLLNAVLQYDDFPILLEAWRTCVQDEFDLEGLRKVLAELESGSITWSEVKTGHPSPMAQNISWKQISQYMYRGDEPSTDKETGLRSDLLRDLVYTPELRPTISSALVEQFELKRQRLSPGYSPSSPRDLLDWVKERIVIPNSEWERLQKAMTSDHGVDPQSWLESIGEKLVPITPPKATNALIVSLEMMPRVIHAFYGRLEHVDAAPIMRSPEDDPDELLTSLLGEWLQFYGPTSITNINRMLGIENQRLNLVLEDLIDSEKLITGKLVIDGNNDDICDSENFEHLLRLSRAAAIPSFNPLEIEWLPLFLATQQGVADPDEGMEGLFQSIEQLLCYQMPVAMWEKEAIPARVPRYDTSKLDTIMQEGDLRWIGMENRRVAFCFESDLDLMLEEGDGGGQKELHMDDVGNLFPDTRGRYDFSTLLSLSKCRPSELADRLWGAVWAGKITNDTFMSIRRGITNRFKVPNVSVTHARGGPRGRRSGRRAGFSRWKNSLPFGGNWFRISWPETSGDLIEIEERNKDRVRLLLDRYGILFRELLQKELPTFRWSNLFRSLRLMELSGEVLSGYFFKDIPGPQFISHRAFQILQKRLPEEAVWWVNATDPASLCGIPIDAFRGTLPKRLVGTHLVWHGKRLVLISNRNGKAVTILVPPDDPNVQRYMGSLHHLLTRSFQPMRRITIETINDEKAIRSPYVDALRTSFELMVDYKNVILYRK